MCAEAAFVDACQGPGELGLLFAPVVAPAHDFAGGCVLARELIEDGARFIQVEYPYEAFGGFDAHEHGARRTMEIKRRIDRPIARLIRELDDRGLLDRTLVVVASEFGRTVASAECPIQHESQYGFHSHFAAASSMLFFGGPFKRGFAYGRTADQHPMVVVENPVRIEDVHATIHEALGVAVPGARGGKPIGALLG